MDTETKAGAGGVDRLLLVDDDLAFRTVYRKLLEQAGFQVTEADDRPAARVAMAERCYPVILLDLMLPPDGRVEEGIEQLSAALDAHPRAKVVVVSGAGDVAHMVRAVRAGAYDFLTKPVDPDVLLIVVQRAMKRFLLEQQVERLQASLSQARPGGSMLGESPAFLASLELARRVAPSDLPVLITGETGTGKELMARTVHEQSPRREQGFLAVNCGALHEGLLESTLFGHLRGAFTGAERSRKGLFLEADRGTLFLDEIGEMSAPLQIKLLRTLETGELLPVGADRPIHTDVRLISATNRDLQEMMSGGAFREDLYWRIKGMEIALPPLRRRQADLPLLARHFLNQSASLSLDGKARTLAGSTARALRGHAWSGNLRELRFEMQRATVLSGERGEILPEDLSLAPAPPPDSAPATSLPVQVEALERREIEAALIRAHGNRTHTASALGLSRQGLLKKMARYGLG